MRVLKNILISLGLLILAAVVGMVINVANPPKTVIDGAITGAGCSFFMMGATSAWASISSSRLEFRKFQSGLSLHPVTIFLISLLFWIIVFPWFLTVRDNIKDGSAELKDEFKQETSPSGIYIPSAPSPLPTPVQGPSIVVPPSLPPPLPAKAQTPTVASAPIPPELNSGQPTSSSRLPPPLPNRPMAGHGTVPPPLQTQAAARQVPVGVSQIELLQKLAELKSQGILTDEEFVAEKRKVLG